jgi:uncharacterized MAPEG superfamily protein
MIIEHWMLFGAALLGLVHIGAASFTFKMQVGNAYTVGSRDPDLRPAGIAARLHRAQVNFLETFPLFLACVYLVDTTGAAGALSGWGSALYLAGRVVYLPLYACGIPWLRTLSWNAATLGLALTGAGILSRFA